MKILFCTFAHCDSGLDPLYDGLCRILGSENVIEYPHKPGLHGSTKNKFGWYPAFFDYPTIKTDEEKVKMLENEEFDIILVASNDHSDFRWGGRRYPTNGGKYDKMLELVKIKSKTIPTYIIDNGDGSAINNKLRGVLTHKIYFKREYLDELCSEDKSIIPLSLSYSEKYVPDNVYHSRQNILFFAGKMYPEREPFVNACAEITGRGNSWNHQSGYAGNLDKYTIGVSLFGFGNDTIRYYEVPAHGMLLMAQRPKIRINNAFEDGLNAVLFDTLEEFKIKAHYYLNNLQEAELIARTGREHFLKYHTSTARAKELLKAINDHETN